MSTRLILIRHGETDWSAEKRYCGFTDIGLNTEGAKQAERVRNRLRDEKVDRIYSSDLKRALDFARIVFNGKPIEALPELREMNFGIFGGLTYEEIIARYPEIYTKWINKPFDINVPEGEGLAAVNERVEAAVARIISFNKDKTAAIVTHGGPIRIVIGSILGLDNIWELKPDLASISIIEIENNKGKVVLFNDRSHLDG